MNDDDLAFLAAVDLMTLLHRRATSSRQLLEIYLDRVERFNPSINAIVTLDIERARTRATEADEAMAHGEVWGPLHGLPITVKDVFETKGLLTTAGAAELRAYIPTRDAVLVARLRQAGAVIFGKTNTPPMAGDGQTFNSLFGTTNNPWDLDLTPGGSSGGCGAAVSAGLTALSFGSDIAGSIRIPASFCGIYGHKPTYGLIPQRGHIPGPPGQLIERDLNVVGPIARDARDLDLALSVLAGPTGQDALGWHTELPPPLAKPLGEYRIAAWLDDPACPVDTAVEERFEVLVEALRCAGATVDVDTKPDFTFEEAFDIFRRLRRPDEGLSHADWLELDQERQRLRELWAAFFERYDVLLCPVCTTPPFQHDQSPRSERKYLIDGNERPYSEYIAWACVIGVAYLPSTSTPIGRNHLGRPIGVQVVGPHTADRRTINFADRLHEVIGGFERPGSY